MKIINEICITKNKSSEIWHNISGNWQKEETTSATYQVTVDLLQLAKQKKKLTAEQYKQKCLALLKQYNDIAICNDEEGRKLFLEKQAKATNVINNIINFFTEFDFEPNFRFINTLANINNKALVDAKAYVINYFKLSDSPYTSALADKLESREFKDCMLDLRSLKTNKVINKRFEIYYGSQGTGKTTKALEKSNNVVMVCHSAMLPSDLLEDFKFTDGKAEFIPSALYKAMENGTIITLDEINLLPFESLRFLQSILDNKTEITYKGKTIHIRDGFKIIGTMNLVVNGSVFSLPEPLIDRCQIINEYKLSAENLLDAII